MCSLERRGRVFILTLAGDGEHRLSLDLIASLREALARAKSESSATGSRGFFLVTTAEGRFFSNGFDLAWAKSEGSSSAAPRLVAMRSLFRLLVGDLLSLPMPTVAAVTGHAAAAGFLLAISHDYVEMRDDKGVLYMSEIDIGMPVHPYFLTLLRSKFAGPKVLRTIVLEGKKIRAAEAAEKGVVDRAHGSPAETVEAAVRRAEELATRNWAGEIYSSIRRGTLPVDSSAVVLRKETEEDRNKLLSLAKL